MKKQNLTRTMNPYLKFLIDSAVTIISVILLAIAIPLSGLSGHYLVQEIITRLARNSFLVLSLLIPVMAGMGMNFSIVLGAMAGEIGLIFTMDWQIVGMPGILLAMLISTPLAILLGYFGGIVLDLAKGREMVTGFIMGFFMNGVYQLVLLYGTGNIIPISNPNILLSRGYGIRNAINMIGMRKVLDKLITLEIGGIVIPVATFLVIAMLCVFIIWFKKTKFGQVIRAVGQNNDNARTLGINVGKARILSIIISTIMACYGQIIFLQNIGTMNTYNSHEQVGVFSIAALLMGGASVSKATIPNAFIGITLFHMMFIVAPWAGKRLIGQAQLGEYFRVFISYGVIAFALALYAWRKQVEKENKRRKTMALKKGILVK